jgi:uncharacterized damage-inducible protein DinB
MAGTESTREGERGGGQAQRQSRRAQGLPPEETKTLDELKKERHQAIAAKRKAAKEQKERESQDVQDQPDSEPVTQGAHHANLDASPEDGSSGKTSGDSKRNSSSVTSVEAEGVSIQDAPAQASEGGAKEVESSAESGHLGPPKPSQDAHDVIIVDDDSDVEDKRPSTDDILDEAPTIKSEGPLSAVTEESVFEDAPTSTHVKSESPPDQVALPRSRESSLGTPPSRVDVDLTSDTSSEAQNEWMSVEQAKVYVAEQVTRWERVVVEHVASPTVCYDWPIPAPDFRKWWVAMTATTEFVTSRMSDTRHPESWIAEWQLVRLGPNTANDLGAIAVSPSTLSARECAALLQSLFFEAGFRFRNLIPEWFRARASRMNPVMIRSVTETLQHLLAAELFEWRTVTTGVPSRIVPEAEALALKDNQDDDDPDIKAEDQDGDLIMSPYEAEMLGRDYIRNLTRAGVRPTRSPTSSYTGEPESKRPYLQPSSVPSLGSHLSIHSSARLSQDTSNPSDRMSVSHL